MMASVIRGTFDSAKTSVTTNDLLDYEPTRSASPTRARNSTNTFRYLSLYPRFSNSYVMFGNIETSFAPTGMRSHHQNLRRYRRDRSRDFTM